MTPACSSGWESLRGDPLPWLLDDSRPNLKWRTLVELVRRPRESPAVRRAQGGASASEPVASILEDLHPDGEWVSRDSESGRYSSPLWRLAAAVLWGADPSDPRIQAAARRILDTSDSDGGFSSRFGGPPGPQISARALQALAELGWCRHARYLEALAWLEEPSTSWGGNPSECKVTAVATLSALTACTVLRRDALVERAISELRNALVETVPRSFFRLGHPNLGRSDVAEIMWALAMATVPLSGWMIEPLRGLQRLQQEGGRWRRAVAVPSSLPLGGEHRPCTGRPSRWITLRAAVALLHYAVDAGLPRLYPAKPKG